jgi:hypothetical protein
LFSLHLYTKGRQCRAQTCLSKLPSSPSGIKNAPARAKPQCNARLNQKKSSIPHLYSSFMLTPDPRLPGAHDAVPKLAILFQNPGLRSVFPDVASTTALALVSPSPPAFSPVKGIRYLLTLPASLSASPLQNFFRRYSAGSIQSGIMRVTNPLTPRDAASIAAYSSLRVSGRRK